MIVTFGVLLPRTTVAQSITPTFVQGTAFSTSRVPAATVTLTRPVAQGDLLVGWFSQYNAPGQVEVSDNVNGSWMRAPAGSLTFDDDTGDIALYYRENSRAAPGGLTITVRRRDRVPAGSGRRVCRRRPRRRAARDRRGAR